MDAITSLYTAGGLYLWAGLMALVLIGGAWLVMLQVRLNRLEQHYDHLIGDGDPGTLQAALDRHLQRIDANDAKMDDLTRLCEETGMSLDRALQKVGLIRFNPFPDTGGDQSFSMALLDAAGDGVVLTSLFSRSETRIFAKPILKGTSRYTLTDEERSAIDRALNAPLSDEVREPTGR